jgi:hypothetical protein
MRDSGALQIKQYARHSMRFFAISKICLSSFYGKVWCVGNTARRAHYVLLCCFSKSQRLSSMRSPAVLQLKSRTRKRNILLWSFSKHSWRSRYKKFCSVANKTYWHCSQRFALPFSSKSHQDNTCPPLLFIKNHYTSYICVYLPFLKKRVIMPLHEKF